MIKFSVKKSKMHSMRQDYFSMKSSKLEQNMSKKSKNEMLVSKKLIEKFNWWIDKEYSVRAKVLLWKTELTWSNTEDDESTDLFVRN